MTRVVIRKPGKPTCAWLVVEAGDDNEVITRTCSKEAAHGSIFCEHHQKAPRHTQVVTWMKDLAMSVGTGVAADFMSQAIVHGIQHVHFGTLAEEDLTHFKIRLESYEPGALNDLGEYLERMPDLRIDEGIGPMLDRFEPFKR